MVTLDTPTCSTCSERFPGSFTQSLMNVCVVILESCNLMCTYTVVTHPCHIPPLAQARPMMLCIYNVSCNTVVLHVLPCCHQQYTTDTRSNLLSLTECSETLCEACSYILCFVTIQNFVKNCNGAKLVLYYACSVTMIWEHFIAPTVFFYCLLVKPDNQ